ncbi:MAG: hypothetical protein RM338_17190 [Nostoc sp. DedQUE12a]|nr:hypothetical protein [Nostoc sp. DedQUE12a]
MHTFAGLTFSHIEVVVKVGFGSEQDFLSPSINAGASVATIAPVAAMKFSQ